MSDAPHVACRCALCADRHGDQTADPLELEVSALRAKCESLQTRAETAEVNGRIYRDRIADLTAERDAARAELACAVLDKIAVALAAKADEREECAKLALDEGRAYIAAAIRARGGK